MAVGLLGSLWFPDITFFLKCCSVEVATSRWDCPLGPWLAAQTRPPKLTSTLQTQNLNFICGCSVDSTLKGLAHV